MTTWRRAFCGVAGKEPFLATTGQKEIPPDASGKIMAPTGKNVSGHAASGRNPAFGRILASGQISTSGWNPAGGQNLLSGWIPAFGRNHAASGLSNSNSVNDSASDGTILVPIRWIFGKIVICKFAMYIVHCTIYTVHCLMYTVQSAVYTVQCTVYNVHCTVNTSKLTFFGHQ